jgi:uncharacterized protein YggE
MRCPRFPFAGLVMSLCLLAGSTLEAQVAAAAPRSAVPEVETVGTGERRVAPDRANVHLTVESRAASAAAAAAQNVRSVQAVLDTLRRIGLDTAVATSSYNVGPNWEPDPERREPRRVGYVARTVLRVRLTRLEMVGRVIDAGLAKGATGIESVWFEASTVEQERRAALAEAALAARRDAEALARSLGGSLGPLLSSSTVGANDPRRINMMMSAGGSAMRNTQITPTEIVISAAVVTRWQFIPSP